MRYFITLPDIKLQNDAPRISKKSFKRILVSDRWVRSIIAACEPEIHLKNPQK